MAIRHSLAGQFGKTEAAKRFRWRLDATIVLAAFLLGIYGFVWGYFWAKFGMVLAILPILAVFCVIYFGRRPVERYFNERAIEGVKYLRGGQCEALIAWLLEDLDDDWHIFNSIKLETDSDIDHVLIGPGGLFCISTKSMRGMFSGTADGLLYNGQPSPFAQQAMRMAMDIKDRLGVAMGKDVPWVQAVLAVPLGYTLDDACGGRVWLVHQDNLLRRLAPDGGPKKLTNQQISRTVKTLEMIKSGAADVYIRNL